MLRKRTAVRQGGIRNITGTPGNRKLRNRTDGGKFFKAKFVYFFHAASGIPFRVLATFGHSRSVSDKPQTMSGLSGVPKGTSSQNNIKPRANRNSPASAIENRADADSNRLRAVMFYSEVSIRDTHKSPKIVCRLADSFRGVFQTWKDTDHRRCQARRG